MGVRIDGSNDVVSAADGTLTVDGLSLNVAGIITASGGFKVGSAVTISSNGNATFSGITTFGNSVHTGIGVSVGIGTDIPEHALVVRDTGLARLRIRNDTASSENYASLNLKTAGFDNGWSVYSEYKSSDADNYLKIFKGDGTATHMYFKDPNEVGIRSAFYHVDANGDDQGDSCFGFIVNTANPGFKIKSGGTERFRITSAGLVGINSTSPATALDIQSTKNSDGLTITKAGTRSAFLGHNGSGNEGLLTLKEGGTTKIQLIGETGQNSYINSGNLGIGTDNPAGNLEIDAASTTSMIMLDVAGTNFARLGHNSASGTNILDIRSEGHTRFLTNGNNERLRITSDGQVRIGSSGAASNKNSVTPLAHVDGSGVNGALQVNRHTSVGGGGAQLMLTATRGSSVTSHTVLQDNDGIGTLVFAGSDGGEFVTGAEIQAVVDGTPGDDDLPTELIFRTNSGGASPTDAMRIDPSGRLLVGKTSHTGDALFVVETEHASGGIIGEFDNNNSGNFGGMRVLGGVTDRECRLQALYGNSFFTFYTEGSGAAEEAVRIKDSGSVLIGQTNESFGTQGHILNGSGQHYIICSGDTPLLINRQSNDGELIRLAQDGSTEGSVTVSGGTVNYGQFLGSHWGRLEDDSKPEILAGTILETVNKLIEWKVVEFTVDGVQKRQAYNGSAEVGDSATVTYEGTSYTGTIANEQESLPRNKHVCVKVSDTAASKAVFGVFLGWDETPEEDIIGTWNDMNIGAIGNYFIRIKSGQSLEIGDLIESDGSGCGVVQSDDIIRSKTVAKVTSTIPQTVYSDGSFLVTCVLYSG